MDPASGEVGVLRPDFTAQVARMVSARMSALHEAFHDWVEAREATEPELLRCHTEEHLHAIRRIDGRSAGVHSGDFSG